MSITLADTECDSYRRTRKATGKLLSALFEHHDFRVPKPSKAIPIYEAPPMVEPIEVIPPIASWFYMVDEIGPSREPRIEQIIRACARYYSISKIDILSARRTANVVKPRQVAMYLAKKLTKKSLPEIGRRLGRDHTSVLSGVRKIERLRSGDVELAGDLQKISHILGGDLAA